MSLKALIREAVKAHLGEIVANRRHLHAHPELSFQEHETSKFVAEKLRSFGLSPQEGIAGTGLVAVIEGKNPHKKTVALRADMDALPIQEQNQVPYRSQVPGVMHACGHDVHTSSLLGAAQALVQLKDQFEGSIRLIFQPGEEKAPGGASLMIKEGVLQNPAPASIFGQHVMPFIPVGKVGFREGKYMASCDEIIMSIKGKGGHGAMPENFIDSVLIASHIVVALQQIVSRQANPRLPSVLSIGRFIANGATNVIPGEVYLEGTFRTFDEEWRERAVKSIRKIAEGIAESMGAVCELEIVRGYPYLVNNPALVQRSKSWAIEYMGAENVQDLDIWMAAEDFAYYSHYVDACFYRLGTRNEAKGIVSGVHTPTFDIDEAALETGAGLMAWLAVQELQA